MQSTSIGRTGLKVSRFAVGGMNFGSEVTPEQATAILDRALELGIYFIDTANIYPVPPAEPSWGLSETIVGKWLQGKRDAIVLSSKCGNRIGPGANDIGGSRKHIIKACEDSLRRLGTDYLDIYYLHKPELFAPIDESLEAMDRLIQDGKIRYFGLSKFAPWQLALAIEAIAESRLAKVAVLQERYSLVARGIETDIIPLAKAKGMGIVAYGPLGGGLLAGMLARGEAPPAVGRFAMQIYRDRYLQDDIFEMADAIAGIAGEMDCSVAQVSLAWLLQQSSNIVPLIGALEPDHLSDSVKALDMTLPEEAMTRLDQLSTRYLANHSGN